MATEPEKLADYAHLMAPGPARPLLALAAPLIEDMGYQLIRIRMTGQEGGGSVVQIMADRSDALITIDDCEQISRALSALLDVEDPISGNYVLEVSSPGMARPLCRPVDFERWAGFEAKLELGRPVDGRKRFRGRVDGFENGEARLEVELEGYDTPQTLGFRLADIAEARLVATDEMMEQSLKARGKAKK